MSLQDNVLDSIPVNIQENVMDSVGLIGRCFFARNLASHESRLIILCLLNEQI